MKIIIDWNIMRITSFVNNIHYVISDVICIDVQNDNNWSLEYIHSSTACPLL